MKTLKWILSAAAVAFFILVVGDTASAQRRAAKRKTPVTVSRTNVADSRAARYARTMRGERLNLGGGDWESSQRRNAHRHSVSNEDSTLGLGGNDFERTKRPVRRRRQ